MSEKAELTGQAAGVGKPPETPAPGKGADAATAGGQAGVAGAKPTAGGAAPAIAEPKVPEKVDLTKLPEFKEYQSGFDRDRESWRQQRVQLEQQLAEQGRQMEDLQRQVRLARLEGVEPDEAVQMLQQELQRLDEERVHTQEQQTQESEINQRAIELLEKHGLSQDTPGLDWSGGPTVEGLQRLTESVLGVVALGAQAATRETKTVATEAAQAARQQALRETGVVEVSTGTGAAPASANPIADVNEADDLLKMGLGVGGAGKK